MRLQSSLLVVVCGCLGIGLAESAAAAPEGSRRPPVLPGNAAMSEALQLRQAMVAGLVSGKEQPAVAIARLQAHASPSGLKVDRDASVGFAAFEVGLHLLAIGRLVDAEEFFRAAEKALVKAVQRTPESAAVEKAQYLSHLALVRAHFLNKAAEAKDDLEAARKLRPDDKYLESLRGALGKEHGGLFKERPRP